MCIGKAAGTAKGVCVFSARRAAADRPVVGQSAEEIE